MLHLESAREVRLVCVAQNTLTGNQQAYATGSVCLLEHAVRAHTPALPLLLRVPLVARRQVTQLTQHVLVISIEWIPTDLANAYISCANRLFRIPFEFLIR